jgi:hypothetical protein
MLLYYFNLCAIDIFRRVGLVFCLNSFVSCGMYDVKAYDQQHCSCRIFQQPNEEPNRISCPQCHLYFVFGDGPDGPGCEKDMS